MPGEQTSERNLGWLLAAGSAAAFATLAIWGRLGFEVGLRSATLLQWRFGVAALVLAAAGRLRGRLGVRTRVLLLAAGGLYTLQTALYFAALERITAGTTALLLYLAPSFVVLYSWLLGRRPTGRQLLAVAVATAGLMVIVGLPGEADRNVAGLFLAAGAGAAYAAYLLAGELLFSGVKPLTITAHNAAGATVGFVLVDLVTVGRLDLPSATAQWGVVAGVVAVPTLAAIPMVFAAIARIGAARTAIVSTLEPVFTALFAWLVLAEALRPVQALGGLLVLAGAVLAQRGARLRVEAAGVVPPRWRS